MRGEREGWRSGGGAAYITLRRFNFTPNFRVVVIGLLPGSTSACGEEALKPGSISSGEPPPTSPGSPPLSASPLSMRDVAVLSPASHSSRQLYSQWGPADMMGSRAGAPFGWPVGRWPCTIAASLRSHYSGPIASRKPCVDLLKSGAGAAVCGANKDHRGLRYGRASDKAHNVRARWQARRAGAGGRRRRRVHVGAAAGDDRRPMRCRLRASDPLLVPVFEYRTVHSAYTAVQLYRYTSTTVVGADPMWRRMQLLVLQLCTTSSRRYSCTAVLYRTRTRPFA
jgi:hypothetical protein